MENEERALMVIAGRAALTVLAASAGCLLPGCASKSATVPATPRDVSLSPLSRPMQAGATFFTFSDQSAGDAPVAFGRAWLIESTNPSGPEAIWQIATDDAAPSSPSVLELIRTNHDSSITFNLCWLRRDTLPFQNGIIRVSLRAVGGERDRGGGVIWRALDQANYYVCRFNPLEGNIRVYRVVNGVREQLDSADVGAAADQWHRITVEHQGDKIRCALDDRWLLAAQDRTFPASGGVGVWTKSDARTRFDDFEVVGAVRQ